MKSMLIVIATLLVVASTVYGQNKCETQLADSDQCLKKAMYIGDWNLTLVKDEASLTAHCQMVRKNFACVKKYQKCLRNFPREVFNILARNARTLFKDRCESDTGRNEFLRHIKCLDESTLGVNVCMDKSIMLLNYIADNVEGERDTILHSTCCAAHFGFKCFYDRIENDCASKTGVHDTSQYVASKINAIASDIFDLACQNLKTLDACEAQMPELMASFRKEVDGKTIPKQQISPLIPIMKIVNKVKI